MSDKDDAAPFLVLKKDAETFKTMFERDVDDCIQTLDSKITSLICEPEFLVNPFGEQRRASSSSRMEFSKAKYDVFLTVKTLFNDMEDKWKNLISEMKESFLESVELFLAGTKLEVKFPSSNELSRLSKISPLSKEKKSADSIYPSLHLLDDTFVPVKRDSMRRKTYSFRDELPSSPALNLSPLKQNLCDIEEEEINEVNDNVVEFTSDDDQFFPSEKVIRNNTRRKTIASRFLDNDTQDEVNYFSPPKILKATPRRKTSTTKSTDDDMQEGFPAQNVKANTRRRSLVKFVENDLPESDLPERTTRNKTKRKTIGSTVEDRIEPPVAPSPKRLKRSGSLKTPKSGATGKGFSFMECDEPLADKTFSESPTKHEYNFWFYLASVSDMIPKQPAVYELKVDKAKKTAFIGSAEDLCQRLLQHKKVQNSGHKHLDKFLERNINDVQVRYELLPSLSDAKLEVKNRVKEFVDKYKTTPAYN